MTHRFTLSILAALLLAAAAPVRQAQGQERPARDFTRLVNLFIGTGAHGHTHPAATVPHGLVQPGPDTRWAGWDACSGYHYSDSTLNGFALTRLSGTGCADLGDFLFMPFTGDIDTDERPARLSGRQQMPWASAFSHADERARPGYYGVRLLRYGVDAEMTATERAAMMRFVYSEGQDARLLLDLGYGIQEQITLEADGKVEGTDGLTAHRRSYWWAYDQKLFLAARFSQPVRRSTVLRDTVAAGRRQEVRCKLLLDFGPLPGGELLVRAAVSAVDAGGAARNLEAEMPHYDFGAVSRAAGERWNAELSRVEAEPTGGAADTIFYTALYHAALAPVVFHDTDGRYRGMDLQVHRLPEGESYFTVFSLWDTFRALHPLVSLLRPEENEAYVRSLLRKAAEGGAVPKWDCMSNYTACMPGYHFASLAADAAAKGLTDFDLGAALAACRKASAGDTAALAPCIPQYKIRDLLPAARLDKDTLGYIPCDRHGESVARGLEYAYDDWCIARLAQAAGRGKVAKEFDRKAGAWRRYFDAATGFMRGRDSRGQWREPFDPFRSEHRADDYCEGTAWQWLWFVPHDVPGLMRAMGGQRAFAARLDSLFAAPSELRGEVVSGDITGLIGQYAHGNEPGHHIAYLYNYAGRHDRTQAVVDSILRSLYANAPEGLAGNEDCGQMSAWYVLSALGLYQVCPGRAEWAVGRPLFREAAVHLPQGRTLTVRLLPAEAGGRRGRRRDAQPLVRLNGKRLRRPFVSHEALMRGGVLEVEFRPAALR